MSSRLKLARKLYIRANGHDSVTGSPSGSEHESEDDGEYDIADACEGCNMDDEVVYEFSPIKIDSNKLPLIFANESVHTTENSYTTSSSILHPSHASAISYSPSSSLSCSLPDGLPVKIS